MKKRIFVTVCGVVLLTVTAFTSPMPAEASNYLKSPEDVAAPCSGSTNTCAVAQKKKHISM